MVPVILDRRIRLATVISFVVMLLANYGANALRLNGMSTAAVSNIYQNPLTPAGFTFAIWGLIYALLLLHVLFACGLFKEARFSLSTADADRIESAFAVSSFANAAWILAWQYLLIPLSVMLITVIFICLIIIAAALRKTRLSTRETFLIQVPFSIYLGWITVAMLQNVCVLLASLGAWSVQEPSLDILAVLILIMGLVVVAVLARANLEVAYPLVAIWAYVGILIHHVSLTGNMGPRAAIVVTLGVCIAVFVAIAVAVHFKQMHAKTVGLQ